MPVDPNAKGGLYSGTVDSSELDANTRALLIDWRWTTAPDGAVAAATLTYSFPTTTAAYTAVAGYPGLNLLTGFAPVTDDQKAAIRTALDLISFYTGLTFVEVQSGLAADAALRFAHTGDSSSWGYYPADTDMRAAGDVYLANNGNVPAQYFGSDGFLTITHEIGHAMGLKHGHETDTHGALDPAVDDNEFSVMTYASYLGSIIPPPTDARPGSSPISYMMYDIAALQFLYGANFSKVGTTATYQWDAVTGQQFINGRPAPLTGVTETNKIFSTIWTQGAIATYDLSNFSQDQVNDLRPGAWLTFSTSQLADLNSNEPPGTPGYVAKGNIYNALLYNNDERSLVANLITGSGNDTLIGNDRDNQLTAGAGDDYIDTQGGNDLVSGGAGADTILFGSGRSTLRDTLADLNGDVVNNFGFGTVNIQGERIGIGDLAITPGTTTVSAGESTFQLNGSFATGGEFMIAARGFGADAYTAVTFVNYLPALAEGVRVDPSSINGIASEPFLTGDGAAHFTLGFQWGVSAYANTVGYYLVSANGTISDVNILFGNSQAVTPGTTFDLGTPGDGQSIGFFLIQHGFTSYGGLPDDLSFFAPGTQLAAGLDGQQPPILWSASRGELSAAQIFHSFASLNAGGTTQVLSGVAPGGQQLQIGFEDLQSTTGDNDFQDVVLSVWLV